MPTRRSIIAALCPLALACAPALAPPAASAPAAPARPAHAARAAAPVDSATWVDHDAAPGPPPRRREGSQIATAFRECVIDPLAHAFDVPDKILWLAGRLGADTDRQAVNVNAFDEVPNSTWFTNRNHVRALSREEIRRGPVGGVRPEPPYLVTSLKETGITPGFHMRDAAGRTWIVKLDPKGFAQGPSCADVVSTRLLYAAGYNVPHDQAFWFRRGDLVVEAAPPATAARPDDPPLRPGQLDSLLARGEHDAGGRYAALASLFLPGRRIGHVDMRGRRPDDPNDRYTHRHRRELRGLYVLMSWLDSWDTKDEQSYDAFLETGGGQGHVRHYLLDLAGSLGAEAEGRKDPYKGYRYTLDWGVAARRLLSLGLVEPPERRARQDTGIPSVGNFESAVWQPARFKPMQPHPAFHELTDRDGYWGAKLVASFSDAQIAAAIDAAGYEDPRARAFLLHELGVRRDRTARYWFDRVAPLDFFFVQGGELRFHDLATDLGLAPPRAYEVKARAAGRERRWTLRDTALPLGGLPAGSRVELEVAVAGAEARPARVTLGRRGDGWVLTRVRHG